MPIDENGNDSTMADRIEELTRERDAMREERDEVAAAADRNAAKFTMIARCNRQNIELNNSLLKEKKELVVNQAELLKKNEMLTEQLKKADESRIKSETGMRNKQILSSLLTRLHVPFTKNETN